MTDRIISIYSALEDVPNDFTGIAKVENANYEILIKAKNIDGVFSRKSEGSCTNIINRPSATLLGIGTWQIGTDLYASDGISYVLAGKVSSVAGQTGDVILAKTDITGLQASLDSLQAGQLAGTIGFTTKALMDADLAHAVNTLAIVTNDATTANNTTYIKLGASGTGSWQKSLITSTDTRITDLEQSEYFQVGSNSIFRYVKKLELYGANTSKFYSVRYFFRNDVGTRFNFTVTQADDAAGTNPVDVCSFTNSGVNYSGLQEFTLAQISSSGITGALIVDFVNSPATFAINRGIDGINFSQLLIRQSSLITTTADTAYYNAKAQALIDISSDLIKGAKLPFSDVLNNTYLQRLIKSIRLYGADKSHTYILSLVELQSFRIQIIIHDITAGIDVCQKAVVGTGLVYTDQARYWKASYGSLAVNRGMYAVIEWDWTQGVSGTSNYTLESQSGIHADNIFSDSSIADFLQKDTWHEVIRVGAAETYTSIKLALESIYDSVGSGTCARACYHHQILIDLVDIADYPATLAILPEFVSMRGLGVGKTRIVKDTDMITLKTELVRMNLESKLIGLSIYSDTGDGGAWIGEYCIHSDDFNVVSQKRNRRLRQSCKSVGLIGGSLQATSLFGCGISSGETISFYDCHTDHENMSTTSIGFNFHNTGQNPTEIPALVELIDCSSSNLTSSGVVVTSMGNGNKARLVLTNSHFNVVNQSVNITAVIDIAADRYEWDISGKFDGAIYYGDAGMIVLQTTAGQTPSGDAAALIFGVTDELGRGNKCILNATGASLGARLGDCSVINKTLTIGAQTYTFAANHTAQSNTTLIGLINAVITTNPVSEKNIQYEIYPDVGHTRRALNSSGVTIPAGKFVKRTGTNTVALAADGDDIFGFVYRDILNGLSGNVITSKICHKNYITGATSDGKFGITAGALDYAAVNKIGYVNNSIVYRY